MVGSTGLTGLTGSIGLAVVHEFVFESHPIFWQDLVSLTHLGPSLTQSLQVLGTTAGHTVFLSGFLFPLIGIIET